MSRTVPRWAQTAGQLFGAAGLPCFAGLLAAWLALAQRGVLYGDHPAAWRLGLVGAGGALGGLCAAIAPSRLRQILWPLTSTLGAGLAYLAVRPGQSLGQWGWFAGALLIALGAAQLLQRRRWSDDRGEAWRWSLMLIGTSLAAAPFFSRDGIGGSDAFWYYTMMTDVTEQLRAGVFPVWVGQSEYAFNGATFPLRIAPWLQWSGGWVDLATLRTLAPIPLANAVFLAHFLALGLSAYFTFTGLGRHRTLALLVALLWVLSPGVQTPVYVSDQYMTFAALPFLPLVFWACLRLVEKVSVATAAVLGGALGMVWLSHLPIALWTTLLALVWVLTAVLGGRRKPGPALRRLLPGLGLFAAIGLFTVSSVMDLDNRLEIQANGAFVLPQLIQAFPGNLLPVVPGSSEMASYQLGYSLLALLVVCTATVAGLRSSVRPAALFSLWIFTLFVFPVPGVTDWLWRVMPTAFVSINNVWPMQRIFPVWSALIAALTCCFVLARANGAGVLRAWGVLGLIGLAWSGHQAYQLQARARWYRTLPDQAAAFLDRDNVVLTRYSYTSFRRSPDYASHGYHDPRLEWRLLESGSEKVLASNLEAAAPAVSPDSPGQHPRLVAQANVRQLRPQAISLKDLDPQFELAPSTRYALRIDWFQPWEGSLRVRNGTLRREYILPDAGGGMHNQKVPRAFGAMPTNSRVIPLASRDPLRQTALQATAAADLPLDQPLFRYSLFKYSPEDLPVVVTSLTPLLARTSNRSPAVLESPRVWLKGWRAKVNGTEVATMPTAQELVGIPLPAGDAKVELYFRPSLYLVVHFWLLGPAFAGLAWLLVSRLYRAQSVRGPQPATTE